MILCDEWTPAQVKAFRLMVNRSVTWADWDEELLALELQEIQELDLDLSLTGFDPGEIDKLLVLEDEESSQRGAAVAGVPGIPAGRSVAAGPAPRAVRGRHQPGSCRAAAGRAQAAADGYRPALWHRAGFRMARPRRTERLRAGRAELHEEAHRRATRKPRSPATRAQTGRMRSRWCRVSRSPMSGTQRSSPARCSTACCASASCTTSRSSGIRAERS